MKRLISALTLFVLVVILALGAFAYAAEPPGRSDTGGAAGTPAAGAGDAPGPWQAYEGPALRCKTDEVVVRFKPGAAAAGRAGALASAGRFESFSRLTPSDPDSTTLARLKPGVTVESALESLRSMPEVLYAEPDYLTSALYTPSDPGYANQWGLNNTGQTIKGTPGTPGADIDAARAWDIERGTSNPVTVAVVDSGVDLNHPDLSGKLVKGYNWAGISCVDNPGYSGAFGDNTVTARAQAIKGTGQNLTHIGVLLAKVGSPSQDITVSVRNSLSGSNLASLAINPSSVPTGSPGRFYEALSSSVFLHSGSTYYLVVTTTGSSNSNYYYTYAMDNEYAEGAAWVLSPPSPWSESAGYDLFFETNPNGVPHDDNGHGTHVSGIIGAAFNGQGGVGVSSGAKVMPLKALTSSGAGWTSGITKAVTYAVDNSADILNMSLGSPESATDEEAAVQYARSKGVAVLAASGNDGNTTVNYPAGYDNVIGVGSTTNQDQKSFFSNYNATVDVSAPGSDIYSTMPTYDCMLTAVYGYSKNYDFMSGTSMATPMASGLAALVLSRNPSYSPDQVQDFLESGAEDLGAPGRDDYFGYGRINAYNTLSSTLLEPSVTSVSPAYGGAGATVTVKGSHFGSTRGSSFVSFGSEKAAGYTSWKNTEIKCAVPAGNPGAVKVSVTTAGGTSSQKNFTVTSPAWYLAEGTSDWGFDTYVTIENPNAEELTAEITYMTKDGPRGRPDLTLPAMSQTVINPRNDLGSTDFSTKVVCKEGKTIAVDRRMIWTGPGAASPEAHASIGVTAPASTWYLPEGSSDWGFECWVLVQNPGDAEASCELTYMIEGADPVTVARTVPANSRASFNMADDIGANDASIKVTSSTPVIAERAMYRNSRREGHASIGATAPSKNSYLAEGTTDWGFTTYVLVQNPNSQNAAVTMTYMTPEGPVAQDPFTMPGNSRKTIRVNDVLPGRDFSTRVKANRPVIAERAMYWDNGTGEACHASIGMSSPHTTFYLPDGETYGDMETWTLVQNPNDSEVTVELSYLAADGGGATSVTDSIPANSRKTYFMADVVPQGRAAIMVASKTPAKKIMVERAMYWNARGAGTNTIGGFSD